MTLDERVRETIAFPIKKHNLAGYPHRGLDEVVDEVINHMSPTELLRMISDALEESTKPG